MTKQTIVEIAQAKQIRGLVHFTRLDNLETILKSGLHPVGQIHKIGIKPLINDQRRLDGLVDSTSLSIGFPNSSMFYKCRQGNPGVDWAILAIAPSVLWKKDCAFCKHNAADARMSRLTVDERRSPNAFAQMYDELDGVETRTVQNLKVSDPTDLQAEVLVFGVIEPEYIFGVVFNTDAAQTKFAPNLGKRQSLVHRGNTGYFSGRTYARKYR